MGLYDVKSPLDLAEAIIVEQVRNILLQIQEV